MGCSGSQLGWWWLSEQRAEPGGPVKGKWASLVTFDLMPHFQSTLFFKMFQSDLSPITLVIC